MKLRNYDLIWRDNDNNLKKIFHKIFSLSGYKLVGKKEIVKHNSFNAIHKFIFEKIIKKNKLIIFDIGAHDGRSILRFKKKFPDAEIFSFEPTKNLYDKIIKLSSEKIKIFNYALSNIDGEKNFVTTNIYLVKLILFIQWSKIQNIKYKEQKIKMKLKQLKMLS